MIVEVLVKLVVQFANRRYRLWIEFPEILSWDRYTDPPRLRMHTERRLMCSLARRQSHHFDLSSL